MACPRIRCGASHFTDDDHEVLQSWREVVAGVLEIRQQAEDSIIATELW
jgi:hypothetical protein